MYTKWVKFGHENEQFFMENKYKIFWDFDSQSNHPIQTRSDMIIIDKDKKKAARSLT